MGWIWVVRVMVGELLSFVGIFCVERAMGRSCA